MVSLVYLLFLVPHILLLRPFLNSIRSGELPGVVSFGVLGCVLYLDVGYAMEAFGIRSTSAYFSEVFDRTGHPDTLTTLVVAVAPLLIVLGSRAVFLGSGSVQWPPLAGLNRRRRVAFYTLASACAASTGWFGFTATQGHDALWQSRAQLGEELGSLVVLLYVPLHLLAYFVVQSDARTMLGRVYLYFLAAASIAATLPIGQRTNLLLPVLIVVLFGYRPSLKRYAVAGAAALVVAGLLLSVFKWQAEASKQTLRD
jgi:hypothetical protein